MTPEQQQRKMLECAATACGIEYKEFNKFPIGLTIWETDDALHLWNPLTNPADTAEMCAKVGIGTAWWLADEIVECRRHHVRHKEHLKDHDNSRLKAWMFAATMVAAKIGGFDG